MEFEPDSGEADYRELGDPEPGRTSDLRLTCQSSDRSGVACEDLGSNRASHHGTTKGPIGEGVLEGLRSVEAPELRTDAVGGLKAAIAQEITVDALPSRGKGADCGIAGKLEVDENDDDLDADLEDGLER